MFFVFTEAATGPDRRGLPRVSICDAEQCTCYFSLFFWFFPHIFFVFFTVADPFTKEARLNRRGRYKFNFWVRGTVDSGPLARVCSRNFKDTCIHNHKKTIYLWVCCSIIQVTHARLVLKMVWIPHIRLCVWFTHNMYRFTQLCFAN